MHALKKSIASTLNSCAYHSRFTLLHMSWIDLLYVMFEIGFNKIYVNFYKDSESSLLFHTVFLELAPTYATTNYT